MVYTHGDGYNVAIKKLSIRKIKSKEEIIIVGEETKKIGHNLFAMTITESIFNPSIIGSMVIKEPDNMVGDFVVNGQDEIVHIEIETPGIPNSDHVLEFCLTEAHQLGDIAKADNVYGGTLKKGQYKINFMSCEGVYYNIPDNEQHAEFLNKDRFVKIASDGGMVNSIAEKYFNKKDSGDGSWIVPNDMEIEETHNSVWMKENPILYPWGKKSNSMTLMQMMNNLTENSIDINQKHSNFLFWNDFNGWHFKSIRKMITDSHLPKSSGKAPEKSTPFVYGKGDEATSIKEHVKDKGDPLLLGFKSDTEYNHLGLWSNGGYSSYYELIKPNHTDPYFNYVDGLSSHDHEIIDYDYHRDWEEWETIEEYKILPDIIKTDIDKKSPNKSRKIKKNEIYGYFSPIFNNDRPSNDQDFLISRIKDGGFGKQNSEMWQTMFDQTNLEISKLENIYNNVINPTKEKYSEYLKIKNLKEKWDVYRHTICCDKEDIKMQFFAVIDDAKLIQDDARGGIYEYTWREVEIWPKDAIADYEESDTEPEIITHENAPISVVVIPDGLKGVADQENGAFNLNELLNTKEGNNIFVGPGVNVADEDFNDYPEAYQMMPVGGYFKVGIDPCSVGGDDVHFHKHIVQMNRIPSYMLEVFVPEENEEGEDDNFPEEIFFFDVPNAHDGLCDCL